MASIKKIENNPVVVFKFVNADIIQNKLITIIIGTLLYLNTSATISYECIFSLFIVLSYRRQDITHIVKVINGKTGNAKNKTNQNNMKNINAINRDHA